MSDRVATVPVLAGRVRVTSAVVGSAAVKITSKASAVLPSKYRLLPGPSAVKASPVAASPTAVMSPPPVPPTKVTLVPLPTYKASVSESQQIWPSAVLDEQAVVWGRIKPSVVDELLTADRSNRSPSANVSVAARSVAVIVLSKISLLPIAPVGRTTSLLPVPSVVMVTAVVEALPRVMAVALLVPRFKLPAALVSRPWPAATVTLPLASTSKLVRLMVPVVPTMLLAPMLRALVMLLAEASIASVMLPAAEVTSKASATESSMSELSSTSKASSPSVDARLSRYRPYWAVVPEVVSEAVKLNTNPFSAVASVKVLL